MIKRKAINPRTEVKGLEEKECLDRIEKISTISFIPNTNMILYRRYISGTPIGDYYIDTR